MKATRKCSFCGKSFVTRSEVQRYCSEACQAEAKRTRTEQKNNLFKAARPLMEIQHQEYLTFSKAATLISCSRQHFRTEKIRIIVLTSQKRKKGKGNR